MHSDLVPSGNGEPEPGTGSELEPGISGSDLDPASGDISELDLVAASLRADLADSGAFVEGLATKLEDMLPGMTAVERHKQGFRGPKVVVRISVTNGSETLELRRKGANIETVRARASGGITLKSERLDIDAWLDGVSRLIAEAAARSERSRQALQRMLLG